MKLNRVVCAVALVLACVGLQARNRIVKVEQVTGEVTLSEDVDYVITGDTPFAEGATVDITNVDHAVVILEKMRPSEATTTFLRKYIKRNGASLSASNCQVRMYGRGCIIFPYSSSYRPLTCYTEENFQGESKNVYTEGSTDGFMRDLSSTLLINKIKSFKLKRGFMVTFATGKSGWGYSRCFIADQEDLEIPVMPEPLYGNASSYRIFKWYNATKAGVHGASAEDNRALRTTSCFDWWEGNASLLPDVEWISHHIYEDWPSAQACGSVTQTCHMKTNNEPGNSADDHPQDVETVLDNWQNLMRTGLRLCSESSHDGSMNHLKTFITEIDKRGWRCDILDLHCYWEGQFNSLDWYIDEYGRNNQNGTYRPCWISEWLWGSSWGGNGAFASGRRSDDATYNGTKPILDQLNKNPKVERYFYWNSEADFTKIYRDGALTKLGKYYAEMNVEQGYNATANNYYPTVVYQQATDLRATYSKDKEEMKITWKDDNYDMLDSMWLEVKMPGESEYTRVQKMALTDKNAKSAKSFSHTMSGITRQGLYAIRVVSYGNRSTTVVNTDASLIIGESGKYYLQNGLGTFLQAGNSWGTQASLGTTGLLMDLTRYGDKVIIKSGFGENDSKVYFGINGFLDTEMYQWTMTETDEDEHGKVYNISYVSDGTTYYIGGRTSGTQTNLDLNITDNTLPQAKWRLVSKAERDELMSAATDEEPYNVTYLLSNPNFDRLQSVAAWKGEGKLGGEDRNMCMDVYDKTFDVYQEVSGLRPGSYTLKCQGFYRYGSSTTSKTKKAYLYANDQQTLLMSIADEIASRRPTDMATASQKFSNGWYSKNELKFTVGADGKLRFGIRKKDAVSGDWTIFDNFQLFFHDDASAINEIRTDDSNGVMHNLQGIPANPSNASKGIYIRGGRKILVGKLYPHRHQDGRHLYCRKQKDSVLKSHSQKVIGDIMNAVFKV